MRELIGILLLVPQGIVAIVLKAVGSDTRSWFLALHLPGHLQLPAAIGMAVLGGIILLTGPKRRT